MVELEAMEEEDFITLRNMIRRHVQFTGSVLGNEILKNWDTTKTQFTKVMPTDYKAVLLKRKEAEKNGSTAARCSCRS